MEGRLPPEPERTRPEGTIDRVELALRHLGGALDELKQAEQAAAFHSQAARTQIRGARRHIGHAQGALGEAKRSLKRDTRPIADGFGR